MNEMKNDVQNIYKTRLDTDKTLFYFTLPKNKLGNHNEDISLGFVSLSWFFLYHFQPIYIP